MLHSNKRVTRNSGSHTPCGVVLCRRLYPAPFFITSSCRRTLDDLSSSVVSTHPAHVVGGSKGHMHERWLSPLTTDLRLIPKGNRSSPPLGDVSIEKNVHRIGLSIGVPVTGQRQPELFEDVPDLSVLGAAFRKWRRHTPTTKGSLLAHGRTASPGRTCNTSGRCGSQCVRAFHCLMRDPCASV